MEGQPLVMGPVKNLAHDLEPGDEIMFSVRGNVIQSDEKVGRITVQLTVFAYGDLDEFFQATKWSYGDDGPTVVVADVEGL